jgi:hypothetical protein
MQVNTSRYRQYYSKIEPFLNRSDVRTYSGLILFFLTTSFFLTFAIKPTANTVTSLNRQIADGKVTDQKLQEKINALSAAQVEYNKVAPDLPLINSVLPDNPAVVKFAKLVEGVANSAGVDILSLQFSPVDIYNKETPATKETISTAVLSEHNYTIVFSGSYKNLIAFQEYIRKVQRLTLSDKFTINKLSLGDTKAQLSLDMSGKIFSLK